MESAILIIVALLLGYGQGVKSNRKKQDKEGGVLQHLKEKVSRKWQIIREQDEQIWMLKEKIKGLEKKDEKKIDGVYTKGTFDDLQKELLFFVFHNSRNLDQTICFYLYINMLLKFNDELREEKHTQYVYLRASEIVENMTKSSLQSANGELSDFMIFGIINKNELTYDYKTVKIKAEQFVEIFPIVNFNVTFMEVELAFKYILEVFL